MNGLVKLGCACVFLSSTAFVASARADEETGEFLIKMNRPMQAGQKLNVDAKGVQQRSLLDANDAMDAMDTSDQATVVVSLTGEATVLDVDAHGRPTALEYTVATCTVERGGTVTAIAPPGSTLTARVRNDSTIFEVNGNPVSAEDNDVLQMFRLSAGGPTDDEMVGTSQPRRIGESWAIDRSHMAGELKREVNRAVAEGDLVGATTLVDLTEYGGQPCAVLFTQVSSDKFAPPMAEFGQRFDVRTSSMTATFQSICPQDESFPALLNSRNMTVKAVVVDETGAERQLHWSRFIEFQVTPIPASGRVVTGAEVEVQD